jgi:hypothetical protein
MLVLEVIDLKRGHTISAQRENEDGKKQLRCAQGDHEVHSHLECVVLCSVKLYRAAGTKERSEFVATARQSS